MFSRQLQIRRRDLRFGAALFGMILAVASTLALLAGCAGTPALALQNEAQQTYRGEHFEARLRFLDEAELIERYGQRDNLFIAPAGLISRERFIPFDLQITGRGQPAILALSYVELSYGGSHARPINQFHLGQYWQNRDEQSGVGGAEASARERTIRRTLLANQTPVSAGETASGMLLFRGNFPQFGSATVTLQITDQNARPIERAVFHFEF